MKIKESDLAVSIIQDGENELSNLEVFNISKNYNRIYAMGEVYGSYYFVVVSLLNIKLSLKKKPAWGDFSYNSRRRLFSAICIQDSIAYHLFELNANNNGINLLRKSKWNPLNKSIYIYP